MCLVLLLERHDLFKGPLAGKPVGEKSPKPNPVGKTQDFMKAFRSVNVPWDRSRRCGPGGDFVFDLGHRTSENELPLSIVAVKPYKTKWNGVSMVLYGFIRFY